MDEGTTSNTNEKITKGAVVPMPMPKLPISSSSENQSKQSGFIQSQVKGEAHG